MVIEAKEAAGESLKLACRAAPPGKTRSSPVPGATSPTQLAPVAQWLSAPPPSHNRVAGAIRPSRTSSRGRNGDLGAALLLAAVSCLLCCRCDVQRSRAIPVFLSVRTLGEKRNNGQENEGGTLAGH